MTECHWVCGLWTVPMESGGGGMLQVHVVLLAGAGAAVTIAGMTLLCLRLERRLRK